MAPFGLRLWRKLHKRMHRRNQAFFIKNSRELAWGLLFKLGSRTRAALDTSKLLRSRQTADEEVYALIKLRRNIENRHRNRVQGLLKSVVKFRTKMHWPKTSRPLGVLPLCHPHSQCERWLRNIILQYKYLFPSFHVPKNSLREVPHQSIKKFLHNFQAWEETMWDPAFKLDSIPCPCAKYRNKLPDRCFSSGHVAAGLEEFEAMVPGCGSIFSASAASTFFPGRAHWMTKSRALFDQWLKRRRLPTTLHPMFQEFCEEQWLQHVNMLEQSPRLNWAMLQKVKSTLHKTWSSTMRIIIPTILCASVLGFSFVGFVTHGMILLSSRAWMARQKNGGRECWMKSLCKSASLPRGTVFLKRKKQFAKGRIIISYDLYAQSLCSKLLEVASIVLTVMAKTLYSDSPGMQSMPQLWKSLHRHWARPSEEDDVEWNDDLVGFFSAVPRKDILRSVHTIVREYQQHTGCSVLSVDLLSKTGHPGNPRGRTKSSLKRCWIRDIPDIVELSFSTGVFTAAGKCRLQVEEPALATKFPLSFQACRY